MSEKRPWWVSLGWTVRDYLKRVWDNCAEDNVLFLAGAIAFNILLAAIPFFLLLVSGLTYLLPAITDVAPGMAMHDFLNRLLPIQTTPGGTWVHATVDDIMRTRGSVTLWSAFLFTWLSTRLFGSLRTALADVFDIEQERSIIGGKIFDFQITLVATILFVLSTIVSSYLALVTTRGLISLQRVGVRQDLMTNFEYWIGRFLAFVFITLMFFALYKYLPVRKVRTRTALLASLFAGLLFELAKNVFALVVVSMNPQSIYTGAIAAIVLLVVWTYYAALIFLVGGEVGQVYELRRTRRLQREVFI
jgi:membrane protein